MTAPPPERGRRPGGRGPGWRGADQADPYAEPPDDGTRQPTADYPVDDRYGAGQARSRSREPDPESGRPRQRPSGRHSRGAPSEGDRPARPDGDRSARPDGDRAARPDGGRRTRQDPASGEPDPYGGSGRQGRRRSGRGEPAGGTDYGRTGYPDPARYPDGANRDRPPPPGRPAGFTDPASRGRHSGADQFLSDGWFRDKKPARPDVPAGDYDGRTGNDRARPAGGYRDGGSGPSGPGQGGPAGPRYRDQRPGSGERQPGYPRPDDSAQYQGRRGQREVQRGPRTWADYQDKPYQGAAYGYVSDAGPKGPAGGGAAQGYTGEADPQDGAGGGPVRSFTAALGNYRGPADAGVAPGHRAGPPEPVVYAEPGLAAGSPDWSAAAPDQGVRYERTRQLELPDVLPTAGSAVDPADTGQFAAISQSSSVLRSSGVMAVGTLGSRLTGFLRTIAQSYALGIAAIAGAYNVSNTLPNVVYNLALGGILTSVIVPLIVNAKKRDPDSGKAYEQRMFTMITGVLLAVTVVATLATVPIVHIYSDGSVNGATEHLTVIFAYFFIPQIFFYGVSSLIGAVLNTRGSFAAPMWTPILNNVVVIVVLGLYVVLAGLNKTPSTITPFEIRLLGLGTTLGVVVQTVALVPALRKVGFRWQPRTDFHRGEISEIGRMAGWMFCYIGATQIAFLITIKVAEVVPNGAGVTEYNYAWLLFQLPYAVVGISVITALLPRMSSHASAGQLGLVRTDFSSGIRLAATIVVPCSLVLAVLGPAVTRVFLAHGAARAAEAHTMGVVFAVFCLGLLPYMIFQLQLRVFYSLHDSKTPALIGLATMTVNIVTNLLALAFLRHSANLVAGLGIGFGLANVLGSLVAGRILSVRMRGLDGYAVGQSLARMHVAALPAALVAFLADRVIGTGSFFAATATLMLGGGGALVTYVLMARALHIRELATVSSTIKARLGR